MSAISASTVQCKTMADGTLRVWFDVPPLKARDAFELFGAPGTGAALAALRPIKLSNEAAPPDKPKGGELCKWAGMLCADISFREWVANREELDVSLDEETCAQFVRDKCEVESRSELDHDRGAGERFIGFFKEPYLRYMALVSPPHRLSTSAHVAP